MSFFQNAPLPDSKLARYRVLAPKAGVRVSPLCLGAMNLGTAWEGFMGTMDKDTGNKILDAFYDAGGNFIDTSNNYQCEQSEMWIGEWMQKRGNREQIVLATKFTTDFKYFQTDVKGPHVNNCGNTTKSLHVSLRASLQKLQTDYIDIMYVHWWDYTAEVEEVMQALNVMVQQGKILYLGVSDTPAWVVAKANQYARDHGLRQFVVYQGLWSATERDFEHDIIPMCMSEGMAIAPWGSVGRGRWKTKEQREAMEKSGEKGRAQGGPLGGNAEVDAKMTDVLEKVGKAHGISITGAALCYVMSKYPWVYPIVGGRSVAHLEDNAKAIGTKLSEDEIKEIEEVTKDSYKIPFPQNLVGSGPNPSPLTRHVAYMDYVPMRPSIHFD